MNLKPPVHHDPVTIIMVPFDGYSHFTKAIDSLYDSTGYPFKLIVVEGGAPEYVRHELEKKRQKHKNMQIIYTDHAPRMAEAYNLGIVHVRTKQAVLLHSQIDFKPGWLGELADTSRKKGGLICPYVGNTNGMPFSFVHAFIVNKSVLDKIGLFDESVATPFWGLDLENRLKAQGIKMHRDLHIELEYRQSGPVRNGDLKLFRHQWDDPHAHRSLVYLKQKWGSAPEETKYLHLLSKKKAMARQKPAFAVPVPRFAAPAKLFQALFGS
jgi:glycosyltransferase involved in cell wall biosynthesis